MVFVHKELTVQRGIASYMNDYGILFIISQQRHLEFCARKLFVLQACPLHCEVFSSLVIP